MCDHCGCRVIDPVRELMAEHDRIRELADLVRRALGRQDRAAAASALAALRVVLEPHVAAEEAGLFAAVAESEEFTDHIAGLAADHDALHHGLDRLPEAPAAWVDAVHALLALLDRHIYAEDFGLFPAALGALDPDAWDDVARAGDAARDRAVTASAAAPRDVVQAS